MQLNAKLRASISEFIEFWKLKIQIETKTDYLDMLIDKTIESSLFITTESGLEELENPNIFSILKKRRSSIKILHLYSEHLPARFDQDEQKCVDDFVNINGDFALQFKRALRKINY